ncbi:hypothetical protein [Streptomyces sp. YGL11-2]
MTHDEIDRLVRAISDLTAVIHHVPPEDKAEIYTPTRSGGGAT